MTTAPRLFDLDTVMLDVVAMIDVLPTRGNDAEVLERLVTPGGGFNVTLVSSVAVLLLTLQRRHSLQKVFKFLCQPMNR